MNPDIENNYNFIITPEFGQEILVIQDFIKNKIGITLGNSHSPLLNLDDYQGSILINKIKDSFNNNDDIFLNEFISIYKDSNYFKYVINNYLSESLSVFLTSDGINIYNELSFYFYILSSFENSEILIDLDNVNFIELGKILLSYEEKINKTINEEVFFIDTIFTSYFNLLEVLNKMCAFYTFDGSRKLLISEILDLVNNSIDNIYGNLDLFVGFEKFVNKLDFYRGKFLLNFSHIDYIDNRDIGITDTLKGFKTIFDKQTEGYNLIINSLPNENKKIFFNNIYIGNVSFSLSLMLKKTEGRNVEDVLSNHIYIGILDEYIENIYKGEKQIDINNIKEFKLDLLDNFLNLYDYNNINIFSGDIIEDVKVILDDFIAGDKNYNEFQIESMHHILLFSDNIELLKLIEVADSLLDVGKYNNYNFEFFKLKTIGVIISKLDSADVTDSVLIKKFLNKVIKYIEDNMVASQLLDSYSKIYLLISLFYSKSPSIDDLNVAKGLAIKYLGSHGQLSEISEGSGVIYENIQKNIGKSTDDIKGVTGSKGGFEIKQYESYFELNEKVYMHNKFSNYLVEAFNEDGKSFQEAINEMSNIISLKVFHGVTNVFIDGPGLDNINDITLSNTRGFNSKTINILDGYNLIFYYPKNFESIFKEIFLLREKFINKKINTLIKVFLQKRTDEIDKLTGLYNYSKLNNVLSQKKGEKLSFINIKLPIIKTFNNAYGYSEGDTILKNISNILLKNKNIHGSIFRLSGVQIGILLSEKDNIKYILNFIKKSYINLLNINIKINPVIGIVLNESESILEKSNMVLSQLKDGGDNIGYYSESSNISEKNVSNIYYLEELEKALENDGLIPYFQPIVSSRKGNKVDKYECLLRVKDSKGNINSPYHFLNIASEIGKIKEITFIMINKVFKFAATNNADYSINLGSEDLNNNTIEYINELLLKYGLKGEENRFTFEILESEWGGGGDFLSIIKMLKDSGFKIAMDDFGADNSNLNRYLDLVESNSIDILKLDMGIVRSLVDKDGVEIDSTAAMIHGIVNSAHSNGITVLAEYVENENISYYLKRLKVDLFQGFYYGKPNSDLTIIK